MKKLILTAVAAALCGLASAKLPAPVLDDAAKAKAAEAAAKTAWQAKVDAYKLCMAQDRVVALLRKSGTAVPAQAVKTVASGAGMPTAAPAGAGTPTAAAAGAGTTTTAKAAASTPTASPAAASTPSAAAPPTSGAPAAKPNTAEGGGTPTTAGTTMVAAAVAVPPCADPGPFAYAPPDQKPLETSGAHSPAPTASGPPSVRAESATMAPAKPSTATKP